MNCTKCGAAISGEASKCESCGYINEKTVAYDYKTVETDSRSLTEVMDCYEALGWKYANRSESLFGIAVTFKRDRRIKTKEQLNRIQVRLDDAFKGIRVLEKDKTKKATVVSLIIGILGALMFGGGMSLFMAFGELVLWKCITGSILGVIGMGICALGYLAYVKIRAKDTAKMNALIEKKRDDIASLCEEAQKLLS